jgi:hypothetical protein
MGEALSIRSAPAGAYDPAPARRARPTSCRDGGAGPFYITFLNRSRDTFLNGVAVGDGVLVSRIDGDGRVTNGPLVAIDASQGKPSELCWLQVTSDNLLVLATYFGYSTVSTYRLVEGRLNLLQDLANEAIPGDGPFRWGDHLFV